MSSRVPFLLEVLVPSNESGSNNAAMKVDDRRCYEFSYVFEDELAAQGIILNLPELTEDETAEQGEERRLKLAYARLREKGSHLTAMCLSGGGIRSATFNLGVVQALASLGLLDKLDYLSTVSGGGYIGGWLSSWSKRTVMSPAEKEKSPGQQTASVIQTQDQECRGEGVAKISKMLSHSFPDGNEIPQVRFLRDYSNYLSPRVGLLTVDTWTLFAIYLRNLLVNWLMLVPLFFALLVLPRLYVAYLPGRGDHLDFVCWGFIFGVLGNLCTAMDLPTTAIQWPKGRRASRWLFLPFLILSAHCLSMYWAALDLCWLPGWRMMVIFTGFGALMYWTGWVLPSLLFLKEKRGQWGISLAFQVIALISGAVGGILMYVLSMIVMPAILAITWFPKPAYATLAVPAIMVVYLLSGSVFIVGTNKFTGDDDREWWGRAGAILLLFILVWLAAFLCVIYGPLLVFHDIRETGGKLDGLAKAIGLGGLTGLVTALIGKSKKTPASIKGAEQKENPLATLALQAGALFSIFLLLISLSSAATLLIQGRLSDRPPRGTDLTDYPLPGNFNSAAPQKAPVPPYGLSAKERSHLSIFWTPHYDTLDIFWQLFLIPLGFSILIGWLLDPNRFSLHAMYRARLIRAYLGATRDPQGDGKRNPHPFTGFDPNDDLAMKDLPAKPLHIVNIAWNIVKGKRLGWQERKAMSFTVSKLHCGSAKVGYRPSGQYGASKTSPICLGTAMAISGAAASPNMGYHSSPLITLVMAFFNVRLGWWMGNPKFDTWRRSGPLLGFGPMVRDAFGLTTDKTAYIYLSDGGHFENLGLYEMVRRRCRYIVVGDASCDPHGVFEDLGNAIRKVRVDFGIEIELDLTGLKPVTDCIDGDLRKSAFHFAIGDIKYSQVDGGEEEGKILYIKPSLCADLPGDVYHYARQNGEFPHQSTSDQWFNESQFESYRKLGRLSIESLSAAMRVAEVEPLGGPDRLRAFFQAAETLLKKGTA
jgi:hypothetical protein